MGERHWRGQEVWPEMIDRSHRGEPVYGPGFTKHFVIFKDRNVKGDFPWVLYAHVRYAGWRPLGQYSTHEGAVRSMNTWIVYPEESHER